MVPGERCQDPFSEKGSFYDGPRVKLRHNFFFLGARGRTQHGLSANAAERRTFKTDFELPTNPAFFRPSRCPHVCWGSVRDEKMRQPSTGDDNPSKTLYSNTLPGGFLRCWDHPNHLLSVPAVTAASHSLLHSPAGDPWKPGWEPTHLTLGFAWNTRTGYGGSDQVDDPTRSRLLSVVSALRLAV
jgi:hypothetical protein